MLRTCFHKSCKCGCLLDKKVCNNKQKWNKINKCLKIKICDNGFSWNVVNCRFESKRFFKFSRKEAALIAEEECDIETDIVQNKTMTMIKNRM